MNNIIVRITIYIRIKRRTSTVGYIIIIKDVSIVKLSLSTSIKDL